MPTEANQPYLDFFKDVVAKYPTGPGPKPLFMGDHDNQADIIRGMGCRPRPTATRASFHIGNDEFWFIPEGKIDYLIEGVGLVTANQGDIGAGARRAAGIAPVSRPPDGHAAGQLQSDHVAQLW